MKQNKQTPKAPSPKAKYVGRIFTPLFEDLPEEFSIVDCAVYGQIFRRTELFADHESSASAATIGKAVRISRSAAEKTIRKFLAINVIRMVKSGKGTRTPSHYVTTNKEEWKLDNLLGYQKSLTRVPKTLARVPRTVDKGTTYPQEEVLEEFSEEVIEEKQFSTLSEVPVEEIEKPDTEVEEEVVEKESVTEAKPSGSSIHISAAESDKKHNVDLDEFPPVGTIMKYKAGLKGSEKQKKAALKIYFPNASDFLLENA